MSVGGEPRFEPHVVTPERLSEAERRLYELARAGTPLAEMSVKLGLTLSEVDRRLDVLALRLGLPGRAALREPIPESPSALPEEDVVEPGPVVGEVQPRGVTRRTLLVGAGAAVGLAAIGGGVALVSRGGGKSSDGTGTAVSGGSMPLTPSVGEGSGLESIQRAEGAVERREFLANELIEWRHGIFFMDTVSGRIEGWRLAPPYAGLNDTLPIGYEMRSPRFVQALSHNAEWRILIDRTTGNAWKWPAQMQHLAAASEHRLVFEELEPGGGLPGRHTGRFRVTDPELAPVAEFALDPVRFGPNPLISGGGWQAAVVSGQGTALRIHRIALDTGALEGTWPAPVGAGLEGSIEWRATPRDENSFAFAFRRSSQDRSSAAAPAPALYRLSWSEAWRPGTAVELRRGRSFSAKGHSIMEDALLARPDGANHGYGVWPALYTLDSSDRPTGLIKGAMLNYGDALPDRRWLSDGRGFYALTSSGATEGPGYERVEYRLFGVDERGTPGGNGTLFPLVPPQYDRWYHGAKYRGPVPHPRNADLVAAGRLDLYDRRRDIWLQANITSDEGPTHLDPWCGRDDELVFALPHGGHDGAHPPALINARTFAGPPFSDTPLRFRVARAGDCVNLRGLPSLNARVITCLPDGTELRLWEAPAAESSEGMSFDRNSSGVWVAVITADGTTGWVSSAYLDWAE